MLIVGLSAMNGFERELNNRVLAVVPHGEIEPVNQPWNNWQEALAKVQKVKGLSRQRPINFTGLVRAAICAPSGERRRPAAGEPAQRAAYLCAE